MESDCPGESAGSSAAANPILTVVVPAYNAGVFLRARMAVLRSYLDAHFPEKYEVLVVDDGSTDATFSLAVSLDYPRWRVVHMPANIGKHGAIARGMRESRGECCLFMDADVPYELTVIPAMVRLIRDGGFHIAIGDRNLAGSEYKQDMGVVRRAATKGFTVLVRLFVTSGLFDTQCGLKAFRGDVARAVYPLVHSHRFSGDVEVLYIALKYNLAIRRVPVRLQYHGTSTVRPFRDALEMMRSILAIKLRWLRGCYESPILSALVAKELCE